MYRILVCDDERGIRTLVSKYAVFEGHSVVEAVNGMEAVELCRTKNIDIVIMDIMMPELDGFSAVREIRKFSNVPVIMLSARGEEYDRIHGFETGVDDYVVKPFEPKELVARVKAVLRRSSSAPKEEEKIVKYPGITVNLVNYELTLGDETINLPPKELELLYHLASHPNRVYTREQLLEEVWGFDYFGDSRTVDVHVKRLREKLEGFEDGWQLKTVWGVGYKFEVKTLA